VDPQKSVELFLRVLKKYQDKGETPARKARCFFMAGYCAGVVETLSKQGQDMSGLAKELDATCEALGLDSEKMAQEAKGF
jgi:hypothetical protein